MQKQREDLNPNLYQIMYLDVPLIVVIMMASIILTLPAHEADQLTWILASGAAWFSPLMRLHLPKRLRQWNLMQPGMIPWRLTLEVVMLRPRRARRTTCRISITWTTSSSVSSRTWARAPRLTPASSARAFELSCQRSTAHRA